MTAVRKKNLITVEEFIHNYEGSRCQFHEGEVWEAQANGPDQSYLQASMAAELHAYFNKTGGPKAPGGWWILTEAAVRYQNRSLFSHDLAGWRRSKTPDRPRRFPITERPDWVCEILSINEANDLVKKKAVLHENEVPFYWVVEPTEKVISVFQWQEKGYLSILDVTANFVGRIPPFEALDLKANVLFGEEDE